jgi:hypothetical protein
VFARASNWPRSRSVGTSSGRDGLALSMEEHNQFLDVWCFRLVLPDTGTVARPTSHGPMAAHALSVSGAGSADPCRTLAILCHPASVAESPHRRPVACAATSAVSVSVSIHPRPAPFTGSHPDHVRAGHSRWRLSVNASQHCWKACWQGEPRHVRFRRPRHTHPASPERFGGLLGTPA